MNSTELYDLFRSDVSDVELDYLWSDTEVYAYMNDAYRMFVRLTGGIPDFTSSVTQVAIVLGEATAALHPSILRVMSAMRVSDDGDIKVLNSPDPIQRPLVSAKVSGMILGAQRDLVAWTSIPDANDTAALFVYRMPIGFITCEEQKFTDVAEDHHIHLLKWMRALAYAKNDAETFDRARSAENDKAFRDYATLVVAEADRYKHKARQVAYGGI